MISLTAQTRIVAIDLETTGLSMARDRIVEVAAVSWQDGRETGQYQTLVNPCRAIPASVVRIHGITDDMVCEQPAIADVLPSLLEFCRADVLVAHHAPFDVPFLQAECRRAGLTFEPELVADTRELAKSYLPECPNYRLETLKTVLGFGNQQAHRALEDARDCLDIFLAFLQGHAEMRCAAVTARARENRANPTLVTMCETLDHAETLMIEYQDARGSITLREIRPLSVDDCMIEAFCLLRNDKRHFAVERIKRVWKP